MDVVLGIDLGEGRKRNAEAVQEFLLGQAVLRNLEAAQGGSERDALGQERRRSSRDILEFERDQIDRGCERTQRMTVVVVGDGMRGRYRKCRAGAVRTIDVAGEAEIGGGDREHAAEL